jgi:hypothetical protein
MAKKKVSDPFSFPFGALAPKRKTKTTKSKKAKSKSRRGSSAFGS